ncbi:MAG TPA: hypothetical protein VGE46_02705 [Bdellovibrio sp.]
MAPKGRLQHPESEDLHFFIILSNFNMLLTFWEFQDPGGEVEVPRLKNYLSMMLIISALSYFLLYILRFSSYVIDDAYIHLRIARNIAEHGVPYFNLHEKVMGSSPHLWINLMALLMKIFGFQLFHVAIATWLFTSASFGCCVDLLSERFSQVEAVVISWLLIALLLLPSAAGLMETPMAIFIFFLMFVFLKRSEYFWSGLMMGLAVWLRFEFFALSVLAVAFTGGLVNKRKIVLGAFAPLAGYVIYCWSYFDTLVPFPVISKPSVFTITLKEFFNEMPSVTNYPMSTWQYISPNAKIILICLSLGALISFLFYTGLRRYLRTWPFLMLTFSASVLVVYALKRVYVFSWYTPLFVLPLAISMLTLLDKKKSLYFAPLLIVSFINVFFIGCVNTYAMLSGNDSYYDDYVPGLRVQKYLTIGAKIFADYPNATLMTAEIGALGWAFPGRVLDGAALVSPQVLKYHPVPVPEDRPWNMAGAIPVRSVQELKPDIIVSMPTFARGVLREIQSGALPYKLLESQLILTSEEQQFSKTKTLWGSETIYVFKLDDAK